MKRIWTILGLTGLISSCSKEFVTTRRSVKHHDRLEIIAKNLYSKYSKETFIVPKDFDTLTLSKRDKRLLKRQIKCPYIHIIYSGNNARFFQADSVVLFTRTGFPLLGKQHNIIIDMKKIKRDSIAVDDKYLKYYKLTNGVYYIQDDMPRPF